jgi:AcrR family transcriptional regulator
MSPRAQATRHRLIVAARELLLEQGLTVSLSEVAERAGVTRMTLYRHFGPRRELLLEVLLTEVDTIAKACRALLDDTERTLVDRAHRTMTYLGVEFSSAPLVSSIVAGSTMADLEELDPNGSVRGLISDTAGPYFLEASRSDVLRGTVDTAVAWVGRQVLAMVYRLPGERRDRQAIADEVALHFIPSLLRVSNEECTALVGHYPLDDDHEHPDETRHRAAAAGLN